MNLLDFRPTWEEHDTTFVTEYSVFLRTSFHGLHQIVQLIAETIQVNVNDKEQDGHLLLTTFARLTSKVIIRLRLNVDLINVNDTGLLGEIALSAALDLDDVEVAKLIIDDERMDIKLRAGPENLTSLMQTLHKRIAELF
jgi:hypothetical protein